jgi:hypothetical protein
MFSLRSAVCLADARGSERGIRGRTSKGASIADPATMTELDHGDLNDKQDETIAQAPDRNQTKTKRLPRNELVFSAVHSLRLEFSSLSLLYATPPLPQSSQPCDTGSSFSPFPTFPRQSCSQPASSAHRSPSSRGTLKTAKELLAAAVAVA